MYPLPIAQVHPGMVVAEDVVAEDGHVLLRRGVMLTDAYLTSLRSRGVHGLQVRDGLADDVVPRDIVSSPLRAAATTQLSAVFAGVSMAARVDDDGPDSVDETIRRLGPQALTLDPGSADAFHQLFGIVDALLSEVVDSHAEAGLTSLKTHSGYTYQHSVDVAAVGVLLGHRAGLEHADLRELALGCLMHDIGKTYIDVAILDKPGPLDPAERAEIRRHPYLGFELVRRMPLQTIYPAHVAYQHHERQDGAGYPRGLQGSNRMVRTTAERFDPRRMLLLAEIAAVADVYSALISDRPYRPALAHDVAADIIEDMAGRHLNEAVVNLFHRTCPRYPVGHWVAVTTGRFRGHHGVVIAIPPNRPAHPRVRLHVDAAGEQLASPHEIETRPPNAPGLALSRPPDLRADRSDAAPRVLDLSGTRE